jgi:hypothetical protein
MTMQKQSRIKAPLAQKLVEAPSKDSEPAFGNKGTNVRSAARKALLQLLEPLAGFVLDSGLSTFELQSILRVATVRSVAAKQREFGRRLSISGIAASTGIPRGEISRILHNADDARVERWGLRQQSTNRILEAWHQSPRFADPNGRPAILKIYGRGATFESLVRSYGRGIPTRAMLDELTTTGAVEVLSVQRVRANESVAVNRGMNSPAIRAFGDSATALLSTMLLNMRYPDRSQFVASTAATSFFPNALPLLRKQVSRKGADFLAELQDDFLSALPVARRGRNQAEDQRVSVTVFYYEQPHKETKRLPSTNRRNFRRRA